jgi:septum formation protein
LDKAPIWHTAVSAKLTMRCFSEAFLDAYLGAEQAAALGSVGAYRLEGRGIQLFADIQGDYFGILGLPLLELLGFLRARGGLAS